MKENLHKLGIVVLAAGASTRMTGTKQLILHHDGDTMIRRACKLALSTNIENIVALIPADQELIFNELNDLNIMVFKNTPGAAFSSSIQHGLFTLLDQAEQLEAIIFMVCDQPFLEQKILKDILERYFATDSPLIACLYHNTDIGTPALVHKSFFPDLLKLTGEQGAGSIIKQNMDKVKWIDFPWGDFDLDTDEDVALYRDMNK